MPASRLLMPRDRGPPRPLARIASRRTSPASSRRMGHQSAPGRETTRATMRSSVPFRTVAGGNGIISPRRSRQPSGSHAARRLDGRAVAGDQLQPRFRGHNFFAVRGNHRVASTRSWLAPAVARMAGLFWRSPMLRRCRGVRQSSHTRAEFLLRRGERIASAAAASCRR